MPQQPSTAAPDPLFALEDRYLLPTYAKLPMAIERGEGCWVWDHTGKKYLDFYGGHCVTATGHCHPKIVEALRRQLGELIFYSNAVYSSVRGRAAEKLLQLCPSFHQVFFVNSGAEANENALKLARAVTGRREVLSLETSFHGRTYGALSATGIAKYRDYLNTPVPDHRVLPAEQVPAAVSSATAAVLVEPIQSMGGVRVVEPSLLKDLEAACRRHGALLIFDEIQTGVGRTGKHFLYSDVLGIRPDLTTLAKGLGSGYPIGALLVSRDVAAGVRPGDLGTTFGGNPVACAAAEATLDVLVEENLLDHAAELGEYLVRKLGSLPAVAEVRGRGLLVGLTFQGGRPAKEVQQGLLEKAILTGSSNDPAVLRLMPPLVLQREHVDHLAEALATL
ncbi:MAG: aminotransferase class III-fold pyridoxal phosphate-dependent enzyme [Acidobacteriota bacterium]